MPVNFLDTRPSTAGQSSQRVPSRDGPTRQDTLGRSNTTTSIATFFLGGARRRSDSPPMDEARLPTPPANYEHVPAPLLPSQALQLHGRGRQAALRASKLGGVEKMSSADRIQNWLDKTDGELSGLERWRREVAREVRKEKMEEMERAEPVEEDGEEPLAVLAERAEHVEKELPSTPPQPNEAADLARSNSNSKSATDETVSGAVITLAEVEMHPYASTRGIDRSTVILGCDPIELPPAPKTPAGFVPPTSSPLPPLPLPATLAEPAYRFPPAAPGSQISLAPLQTAGLPPSAFSSATASPEPGPWTGKPPPRTASLPFGNLVQVSAPPPECAILPPKAAALLGLIPSATAPLTLRGPSPSHAKSVSSFTAASSSRLAAIDTSLPARPRPPFFHYDSLPGSSSLGDGTRKDSFDASSVSASTTTQTAGSFWSSTNLGRRAAGGYFASSSVAGAGRPSFESGSAPTTLGSHSQVGVVARQPPKLGVGTSLSFGASLVNSTTRTKGPPSRLRTLQLRKEGMSSSPDLTTPHQQQPATDLAETSTADLLAELQRRTKHLPSSMQKQEWLKHAARPSELAAQARPAVAGREYPDDDDDDEEQESLVDVMAYTRRRPAAAAGRASFVKRSMGKFGGEQIALVDGEDADDDRLPKGRERSSSVTRSEGGVVGLVRSLSNGKGTAFLSRKLSRRPSKKQVAFRRSPPQVLPLPTPEIDRRFPAACGTTSTVEATATRRKSRSEWEVESTTLARRVLHLLNPEAPARRP
ncbi:hypothetical protein JCM8547_001746 [Rhodosporidiobolus lusitaniae]